MATLVITRGLPGSGKSTWARAWVQDGPRRARLNRDELRQNLFGAAHGLEFAAEQAVSTAQRSAAEALLRAGWDVVVDDTHLRTKYARAWADLAAGAGARFEVRDFTDVPVEVCVQRDADREAAGGRGVGTDVIRDLHQRFLAAGPLPAVTPSDPSRGSGAAAADGRTASGGTASGGAPGAGYVADPALPSAWLVDVDGTLALMSGRRPYDWHRVGEDEPNHPVIDLVRGLAGSGHAIVVVSGRDGSCRGETRDWLARHGIPFDQLLMRAAGDQRRDSIVKREIFEREIAPRWQVRGVLDDRQQVVQMWRAIGLTCAQVAPGDF